MQGECARVSVWVCVTSTTHHPPISSMFCHSVIQLGTILPAQPWRTTLNVNNWIFISPATPYPLCLTKSHPGQAFFTSLFLHRLIRICQITNIGSVIFRSMLRAALSVFSPWTTVNHWKAVNIMVAYRNGKISHDTLLPNLLAVSWSVLTLLEAYYAAVVRDIFRWQSPFSLLHLLSEHKLYSFASQVKASVSVDGTC